MALQHHSYSVLRLNYRQLLFMSRDVRESCQVSRYHHNQATHYEVLGIPRDATQAQVKEAYLTMSKKHHPDLNNGQDREHNHQEFLRVTDAYSVLGNKTERRAYDIQIGVREQQTGNTGNISRQKKMSFEERAAAMGYTPQDPNFYENHGDYHKKAVMWCALLLVLGSFLQGMAVIRFYYNQSLDTGKISPGTDLIVTAGANAMRYTTIGQQKHRIGDRGHED